MWGPYTYTAAPHEYVVEKGVAVTRGGAQEHPISFLVFAMGKKRNMMTQVVLGSSLIALGSTLSFLFLFLNTFVNT